LTPGENEPSLVNPKLPVDIHYVGPGEPLPYWPSYGTMSAGTRYRYLKWLANGAKIQTSNWVSSSCSSTDWNGGLCSMLALLNFRHNKKRAVKIFMLLSFARQRGSARTDP